MTDGFIYQGQELDLFKNAIHWKRYFSSKVNPFIKGSVLEVGAGIGANLNWLPSEQINQLTLLEPDEEMYALLQQKIITHPIKNVQVIKGTIATINNMRFDTILYIDVLEHIKDDKEEIEKAVSLLKPGGHIIILSPAFQSLFTSFDEAIGHYRRYNRATLRKIIPTDILEEKKLHYLDSIGFFASLTNKLFLKQKYPSAKQVSLWDEWMIPVSRITDKIFFHSFGKSIIGRWQKKDGN